LVGLVVAVSVVFATSGAFAQTPQPELGKAGSAMTDSASISPGFSYDAPFEVTLDIADEGETVSPLSGGVPLEWQGLRIWTEGSGIHFRGMIRNQHDHAVSYPTVWLTWTYADGHKVTEDDYYDHYDTRVLYPGEFCVWSWATAFGSPGPVSVSLRIEASPSTYMMPVYCDLTAQRMVNTSTRREYEFIVGNWTRWNMYRNRIAVVEWSKKTGDFIDATWVETADLAPGAGWMSTAAMTVAHDPADTAWLAVARGQIGYPGVVRDVRLSGADRFATAIEASRSTFTTDSVPTCVLVSGLSFPDALSAAPLAGALESPILLNGGTSLRSDVRQELLRLGTKEVLIVGGAAAVPVSVENELKVMLGEENVTRVAGTDRYGTSAAVCGKLSSVLGTATPEAFIVRGDSYADALGASSYAYSQLMPMLLVAPKSAPAAVVSAAHSAGVESVVVVGSTTAVSDAVVGTFGTDAHRIGGANRYQTASLLWFHALDNEWTDGSQIGLVTGLNYPDALCAGPVVGSRNGGVVLTRLEYLPYDTGEALLVPPITVTNTWVFGSERAVSWSAAETFVNLCGGSISIHE
jgi:putative cell wall-binding protein